MMEYIKVTVIVRQGDLDLVCAGLQDIVPGFEVRDPGVLDEFLEGKYSRWDYIDEGVSEYPREDPAVIFYLPEGPDRIKMLEEVRIILSGLQGEFEVKCEPVFSEDWENNWKQFFKPFPLGNRLYIRPSWEVAKEEKNRVVLTIDPSSSFGTGSHATTRMCLEAIDRMDISSLKVLDMGCGSGILGCAAMLLGAQSLVGCDIDEGSIRVAEDNLRVNMVPQSRWALIQGDTLTDAATRETISAKAPYDLITANIVADVLKGMAPLFLRWLVPGGTVLLSGIIDERAEEVLSRFRDLGFSLFGRCEQDGWTMFEMKSPPKKN